MKSHFSISELLAACSSAEREALYSSPSLSRNLIQLAVVLEGIRAQLGQPIMVNSSYRDKAHNKKVGGVATSQHLTASAVDIRSHSQDSLVAAIKAYQEDTGALGQVIIYDTFVHVGLADCCNEPFRSFKLWYN